MFELEKGYYVYKDGSELVAIAEKILNGDSLRVSDSEEVVADYNWDTVAKLHKDIFEK